MSTYRLSANLDIAALIHLNSTNGELRTFKRIDRESFADTNDSEVILNEILVNEQKEESKNPTIINLKIKIRDINDNPPLFPADFQVKNYLIWY